MKRTRFLGALSLIGGGTAVFLLFRTLFALGLLGLGLTMWLEKATHLQVAA